MTMRENEQLFHQFIEAPHSIALFQLAERLSQREYDLLTMAVQRVLVTADASEQVALRQRMDEVRRYRWHLQQQPKI